MIKRCPECNRDLFDKNYCGLCKISICPKCNTTSKFDRGVSKFKAIIYLLLLPVIIISLLSLRYVVAGGAFVIALSALAIGSKTAKCPECGFTYYPNKIDIE